jgi:hypothetical protein
MNELKANNAKLTGGKSKKGFSFETINTLADKAIKSYIISGLR